MFVISSYYTLNTPYVDAAHKYILSTISTLKVKSDIRGVYSLGSWQKNTLYKSTFIREMMDRHPDDNIVFVDCDAEVLRYPELFDNIPEQYDIAAHILDRGRWYNKPFNEMELLTGTLFVRNTARAREIVDKWVGECYNSGIWEQKILQIVLKDMNVPIFELPIEYCYMKTMPNGLEPFIRVKDPVIVHHQLSRSLKKVIV